MPTHSNTNSLPSLSTVLARRAHIVLPRGSVAKRIIDIVGAASLLLAALPVMLLIAVLVKLDGGPVLFRHRRVGANGVAFTCFKFRSMVVGADAILARLLASDPAARAQWDTEFKLRDDPRVTWLGQFLRRTSLDELPQLFNVLAGDMSLVGPRPIVQAEIARYGSRIAEYLACRPGLTGLWQVSGRNDVSYEARVALDARYVREWSLRRDFTILLQTFGAVLRRAGAY